MIEQRPNTSMFQNGDQHWSLWIRSIHQFHIVRRVELGMGLINNIPSIFTNKGHRLDVFFCKNSISFPAYVLRANWGEVIALQKIIKNILQLQWCPLKERFVDEIDRVPVVEHRMDSQCFHICNSPIFPNINKSLFPVHWKCFIFANDSEKSVFVELQ